VTLNSIVIIHHTGTLIYKCLKSIEHIYCDKVVCSSQPTIFPNVISKYVPHNNPTRKRNEASKLVSGDYISFLDDDVVLEENCLRVMQMYMDKHEEVGMCFATLSKVNGDIDCAGTYLTGTGFLYEKSKQKDIIPYDVLSGKSVCCMIRKDLFHDIGGFDEDFVIYCEETDLSWRVWLQGYKVKQLPYALGTHFAESKEKSKEYYNERYIYFNGCKNYISMLIKNLALCHMPIALINFCLWAFVGLLFVFKSPKKALWIYQGLFWVIKNLPKLIHKRYKIQKGRVFTDAELFPSIFYQPNLSYYFTRIGEYLH